MDEVYSDIIAGEIRLSPLGNRMSMRQKVAEYGHRSAFEFDPNISTADSQGVGIQSHLQQRSRDILGAVGSIRAAHKAVVQWQHGRHPVIVGFFPL